MTTTLLIYRLIPEEISVYVLDGVTKEDHEMLNTAHGKYTNMVNNPDVDAALDTLSLKLEGEWKKFKRDESSPLVGPFAHAYISGFLL